MAPWRLLGPPQDPLLKRAGLDSKRIQASPSSQQRPLGLGPTPWVQERLEVATGPGACPLDTA